MNHQEYLKIEETQSGLFSKFGSLRDNQLSWYESQALDHFGLKRLPSPGFNELIQQVLAKSPNDLEKKKKDKTYYVANVVAYLTIIRDLLSNSFVDKFSNADSLSYTYISTTTIVFFAIYSLIPWYCLTSILKTYQALR